jgi:predicted methyltransferase
MNIFKIIKLYNKANKMKSYLEHNLITKDLRKALDNLKADFEVLAGLIPDLADTIKDIKAILNVK